MGGMERFSRTELLIGRGGLQKLAMSRVAVFGIGGVGSYCVEALARSGVGALDLIDSDRYSVTNLNRQLYATERTLGRYKVEVAAERIAEINPACRVRTFKTFFLPENKGEFDFHDYDYVVDAIDTVAGKLAIIEYAMECGVPVISAMGAGNKLDPTMFEVGDVFSTSVCPLARTMRHELKRRGIDHLKVVYSKEPPIHPDSKAMGEGYGGASVNDSENPSEEFDKGAPGNPSEERPRRSTPGSVSFVPSVAGLILAGEVVKDLIH